MFQIRQFWYEYKISTTIIEMYLLVQVIAMAIEFLNNKSTNQFSWESCG